MSSIQDEVRIQASASRIYQTLSTQAGYRGFWNTAAEVPETTGGEAELSFVKDGTPVKMRFRIDELSATERVRWTCIAHDMPGWVGTTLKWQIQSAGEASLVTLEHAGWKGSAPEPVAQGWKHFLGSLKAYVETGVGQPW